MTFPPYPFLISLTKTFLQSARMRGRRNVSGISTSIFGNPTYEHEEPISTFQRIATLYIRETTHSL